MSDSFETTIKNYSGLSSETKPTISVPNGSRWREVDTGDIYVFNLADDTWYPVPVKTAVSIGGDDIGVHNPIPINILRVTVPDLDVANCDNGGFSGVVTDYFDSLKTVNADASATNPKYVKLWFHESFQFHSIGFGCDNLAKSFSNIKISALGSGEAVRFTKDLSADSTKRNSYLAELAPVAVNGFLIEFHTADEIGLSNIILFKAIDVNSRLKAIDADTGEVKRHWMHSKPGKINHVRRFQA